MEIPGYRIERLIAEGSSAAVYLAVQQSLGRQVALKVLKQFDHPEQSTRFLTEGQIIAALNHRNIITIYDIGCVGNSHYIAMEYLEGGSLTDRIRNGMTLAAALDLLETIAGCLDFVHRKGVVHRDVKPDNILFHADGTPKLTDFGIAKQYSDDQDQTMDGRTFGSPYYLSPEQAQGKVLDGRSDIYALGIVFYEMLTGGKPYAAESHVQTILAHISQPIPVLPERYAAYQDLLELMIAKTPQDRFGSAAELMGYVRGMGDALGGEPGAGAALALRAGEWWAQLRRATARACRQTAARPRLALAAGLSAAIAVTLGAGWLRSGGDMPPAALTAAAQDAPADGAPGPAPGRAAIGDASEVQPGGRTAADPEEAVVVAAVQEGAATQAAAAPPAGIVPPPAVTPDPDPDPDPNPATAAAAPDPVVAAELAAAPEQAPGQEAVAAPEPRPTTDAASRQAQIERWLAAAEQALQAYRLTTPAEDSALFYYRQVMTLDPEHPAVRDGMALIADRYVALARKQLQRRNDQGARLYVARGLQVQPEHARLLRLKADLERPRPRRAEASLARAATPAPEVAAVEGSANAKSEGKFVQGWKNFWNSIIPR